MICRSCELIFYSQYKFCLKCEIVPFWEKYSCAKVFSVQISLCTYVKYL